MYVKILVMDEPLVIVLDGGAGTARRHSLEDCFLCNAEMMAENLKASILGE
jgi:hypothetical protein